MASKKKKASKKSTRKASKKNPRKHVPKLPGRGRPPSSRSFTLKRFAKDGSFLGSTTFKGSLSDAENKAASSIRTKKAHSVVLEY